MTAIVDPACTLDLSGRYLIIPSGGLHRDPVAVAEDGLSSIIVDGETFALNDVTLLPVTGEFITTATAAGLRVEGYWLNLLDAPQSPHIQARVLVGGRVTTCFFDPAGLDARTIVQGTADPEHGVVLAAFAEELAAHERTRSAHEQWKTALIEDMHQAADDHDLCEVFDQFCDDHGLPMRTRDYGLRVTLSMSLTLTRQATSAEAAIDDLCRSEVIDLLRESDLDYALDSWDVEED